MFYPSRSASSRPQSPGAAESAFRGASGSDEPLKLLVGYILLDALEARGFESSDELGDPVRLDSDQDLIAYLGIYQREEPTAL